MGIGDWGLGIGDWGLGPIPNPQSPIPNPQSPIKYLKNESYLKEIKYNSFYYLNFNFKRLIIIIYAISII